MGADVSDITGPIREFNAANKSHEELWARAHQEGDAVRRRREEEKLARQAAGAEHNAHLAVQAEHPNRRAPLIRQVAIAAASVGLDAVACWFAAQALGNDQLETALWAGLFLAILAGGEVALDHYSERSRSVWRLLAAGLAAFVSGLGVLRFLFLDTVGTNGAIAALVGAALFTAATAGFVMIGYRALRAAETFRAAQARLRARLAARQARAATARLASAAAQRDRLVDAYLSRIRVSLLKTCTSSELPLIEKAIRLHLIGGDTQ